MMEKSKKEKKQVKINRNHNELGGDVNGVVKV